MRLVIAFQLAWRSLRLNILRTSLTVLGVVIGVIAIIVVFSAGSGISNLVRSQLESYGTNVVETEVKVPGKNSVTAAEITTLKVSDMEAVNKLNNIETSYAVALGQEKVAYQDQNKKVFIFGTNSTYPQIDSKTKMADGYFFSAQDNREQTDVVVLGSKIKTTLFGDQKALGKFIKIGTRKFRVVGVLAEQGGAATFMDFDDMAYIPIKTLQKQILGVDYIMYFMSELKDVSRAKETAEEIRSVMRERHDISDPDKEDFRVSTMKELLDTLGTVTSAITYLLLAIVLISLAVGGVGIMNIMYVAVTERTPEIGLRKAMGATKKDIVWQFLVESLLITFWGWFLGVVIGVLASYLMSLIANSYNLAWQYTIPWQGVLVALVFSLICGLLFGYRPALQAARLDPVTALRVE